MFSDNGVFDSEEEHGDEFMRPFAAAMAGYALGHRLDQTRFGYWFNTNPVIDWIYRAVTFAFFTVMVGLGVMFMFILVTQN